MMKKIIPGILLCLLLADVIYSFIQHYHFPLDGDLGRIIFAAGEAQILWHDPFGFNVLFHDKIYEAPNRFFGHWTVIKYFSNLPQLLQHFTNPIDSVYLANGLVKIAIQVLIIYLIAFYISGRSNVLKKGFIISAAIITPLFQTRGYVGHMGIIDPAISYTFAYALPVALLMLFFVPFFNKYYFNKTAKINYFQKVFLVALMVFLSFNGPLVPAIVLIACPIILLREFLNNYKNISSPDFLQKVVMSQRMISRELIFFFVLFMLLSLYSIYIGMNNSENTVGQIPLWERYLRLPQGLYYILTSELGLSLLIIMILLNVWLVHKYFNKENSKLLILLKWSALFIIIYILLLPLGGYRVYRPYIIRYDTFIPITIILIFFYGSFSYFLIKKLSGIQRKIYIFGIIAVSFIYTFADKPGFDANFCEKESIKSIANAKEEIVLVKSDCSILSYNKITNPDYTVANGALLHLWNITKEKKRYYQE